MKRGSVDEFKLLARGGFHCMFSLASCHDVSVFVVTLVTVMVMMSSPSSLSLAPPPPAQVSLLADLSPHVTPHSVNVATISD